MLYLGWDLRFYSFEATAAAAPSSPTSPPPSSPPPGIDQWVSRGVGSDQPKELFYTDAALRQEYKNWVKQLVTRTNTVTGQAYKDDPTILAWELQNEPRAEGYEKSKGLPVGKIVCDWVWEMSAYVKSLDSNHMVAVGDEGFRTEGSTKEPHAWINNGYEGVDWVCNLKSPSIDVSFLGRV